jgi:hypothetical protein
LICTRSNKKPTIAAANDSDPAEKCCAIRIVLKTTYIDERSNFNRMKQYHLCRESNINVYMLHANISLMLFYKRSADAFCRDIPLKINHKNTTK